MIAFGKPFISNPDLVIRLFLGARLTVANRETFYGGGEEGYTDYQVLRSAERDVCFQDHERAWVIPGRIVTTDARGLLGFDEGLVQPA